MTDLYYMTIEQLAPLIQSRQLSPVELTESILERIEQVDSIVNSYITVTPEVARSQARFAESEIMQGNYRGPLHGIPIAPKDLYFTKGIRTTFGSALYREFVPDYDATPVEKLLNAGIVLTGKVNLHEFANGETNVNVHYGNARNPWNSYHITGGSSGGSGAAVAAGTAIASIGTDTAGSIRIPSAMCGIYGLKTTYGRVSKHGVKGLCESLTCPGPMARCVTDLSIILQYIAGYDPKDATSAKARVDDYVSYLGKSIQGLRIGVIPEYFFDKANTDVAQLVKNALSGMESLGAQVVEVKIPELDMAMVTEMMTAGTEATVEHHETLTSDQKSQLQDDVRILFETGELVTGIQYARAQKARRLLLARFMEVYKDVDIIAAPTVPIPAPPFIENQTKLNLEVWNACTPFTCPANITGLPSLSVPVGLSSDRLPVGMQFFGKPFAEGTLLKAAYAYEQISPFKDIYNIEGKAISNSMSVGV